MSTQTKSRFQELVEAAVAQKPGMSKSQIYRLFASVGYDHKAVKQALKTAIDSGAVEVRKASEWPFNDAFYGVKR